MAGMFYSLDQTKEKLGKNDAEIKALVRDGKLREFRDGAKQLYKTEDVDALASVPKGDTAILDDSMQLAIDETGEISLAPEELSMLMGDDDENNGKNETKFKLDETGALMADEILGDDAGENAKDDDFNLEIMPSQDTKINQKSKTSSKAGSKASSKMPADLDEEPLSNADTNISLSGDSINVLGGSTENEFKISDDTLGETKLVQKPAKALDDKDDDAMSVAKLDDDVNLDSFGGGSGSGLLDLSLQADDTSLGAVLDDIYPETQNAPASKQGTPAGGLAAEAEKIFEQDSPDSLGQEDLGRAAPAAMPAGVMMFAEPAPDSASDVFGAVLFVPMLAAIYTAIVVASGYNSIPELKILSSVQPIIWYVAGGLMAVVILMAIIASASGGEKKVKQPKTPKPAKVVQPKPKKEKKGKKGEPYTE
ncbi:MAG: hypothetical protein ACYC3B_03920 [Sedimentisphaerales bacterium]